MAETDIINICMSYIKQRKLKTDYLFEEGERKVVHFAKKVVNGDGNCDSVTANFTSCR